MPSKLDYSRFVVGYHGCDAALARKVLLGDSQLEPSNNKYDWLGRGIYFWEHGPARAMEFAVEEAKRKPSKIKEPAVLGAYISLGDCFDLLDVAFTSVLGDVYPAFTADLRGRGEPMPENERRRPDGTKLFHALDRAVIEFAIKLAETDGRAFDSVRGAFMEGERAFAGSEVYRQSHIQVTVRNTDCVIGYFKPKIN
ncbi:MAG TPA: hypothetical protein VGL42_06685 [Opitutaceae bacterium]|jgi:hypothetical protein